MSYTSEVEESNTLVRLYYRTPVEEGKGDLIPLKGAKQWVKNQKEKHPSCEYWYEFEQTT